MEQKKLSNWLKLIILGTGIFGCAFYLIVIFGIIGELVHKNPEFAFWYLPWAIFIVFSSIPCYGVLILGWQIANNIGQDKSFIKDNCQKLNLASKLSAIDTAYFFIGNLVLWFLNMNYPIVVLISIVICFAGVVFSVGFAVLAHVAG